MRASTAIIVSGAGRYSDPWHPFAQTSAALVGQLDELNIRATVHPGDAGALDTDGVDLLVVNAGGGSTTDDDHRFDDPVALRQAVLEFTASGGPTLVVHTGSNTFYESGNWARLIGGRWLPGTSMHPPLGPATVDVADADHPISTGLEQLHVRDELYCHLQVAPTARVLATHRFENEDHALVWTHEHRGVRVVYDALGHDAQAYAGADRRELLRREVRWLLEEP